MTALYTLGLCDGDCRYDSDCDVGLKCLQRYDEDGDEAIPQCTGDPIENWDYCIPEEGGCSTECTCEA